jgi:hypothetical protein
VIRTRCSGDAVAGAAAVAYARPSPRACPSTCPATRPSRCRTAFAAMLMMEVVASWRGHGRAAVAARALPAGAVVHTERPFLVWDGNMDTPASLASFLTALSDLPVARQAEALERFAAPREGTVVATTLARAAAALLPGAAPEDVARATRALCQAAVNNHAFGPGRSALFWTGAMVSHACDPNLRYTATADGLVYTATRAIVQGVRRPSACVCM